MKKLYLLQVLVKKKKVLKDNTLRENVYVKVKEPNSGRFLSGYVVWSCMYYFLIVPTTTVDETMEQCTLSWNRKQIPDYFSLSETYKQCYDMVMNRSE